jgi:hypothetical protein
MIAMIMFVVAQQPEEGTNGCIASGAVLHYFLLSAFCWMLCEGAQLYLDFVILLGHIDPFKKMILFAQLVPAIAVIATAASNPEHYGDRSGICWIADNTAFWAAFAGPAFAVMLTNLIVFALVMRNIFALADVQQSQAKRAIMASVMFLC